ncbi:MAG: response regulator [Cyanothece sp. SIO1E1]|nr:response regulator [Cyanothece sp. SIO1E1]
METILLFTSLSDEILLMIMTRIEHRGKEGAGTSRRRLLVEAIRSFCYFGRTLLLIGCLGFGTSSTKGQAQDAYTPFFELEVDGIPFYKKANQLFEDSQGLLWIGTGSGLFRYDGNQLKSYQYNVFDDGSIPNNTIRDIVEDDNHDLWISTESYLVLYRRKEDRFIPYHKNFNSDNLYVGRNGKVYVCQVQRGLLEITPHIQTDSIHFRYLYALKEAQKAVEPGSPTAVYEDEFERRWIGTDTGMYLFKGENQLSPTRIDFPIRHIVKGRDQVLWLSSKNQLHEVQYSKQDNDLEILASYQLACNDQDESLTIEALVLAPDGRIWVGTDKCLFRGDQVYGQYRFRSVKEDGLNETRLISDRITALLVDHYDNLWVGTVNGVSKHISKASVFQFKSLEELGEKIQNNAVHSLHEDQQGNLWIGTNESGLFRYNKLSNSFLKIWIPHRRITCIRRHVNPDRLLIGAERTLYEISNLDAVTPDVRRLAQYERNVMDVLPLNSDEIWVALWGHGLDIIDGKKELPEYKKALVQETKGNHVSVLHKDGFSNIWIGTRGNGLYLVDQEAESYRVFGPSLEEGITANAFLSIWEDLESNIWFGTRGGGLMFYDQRRKIFEPFTIEDGLPSNTITTVIGDRKQNLWLGSQEGLAVYTPADGSFITFSSEYGIHTNHFSFNSGTQSEDQRQLYFGTIGGYYSISTEEYKKNLKPPKTVITSFRSYGQLKDSSIYQLDLSYFQDPQPEVVLPYQQNNVTIGFSSSDLTAPLKNKYAYKLEGVNDYWIFPEGNSKNAVYFDLAPGEYLFQVKSSNSDGVWAQEPTTLMITITPPFWRSSWAYSIYALLFLLAIGVLVFLYRRWYMLKKSLLRETISREKDKQHHQMRMVFFTDISHELRTPLTLILSYIEDIISNNKARIDRKIAFSVYNNALKMKQLINQFMDIRKHNEKQFQLDVKNCEARRLIKSIEVTFMDYAKINQVELHFQAPKEEIRGYLDYFIVEKIVSNLLANALKYTPPGGEITLSIEQDLRKRQEDNEFKLQSGKYLNIVIRDNGIGMSPEDLEHIFDRYYQAKQLNSDQMTGTGIGMELVHKLVRLHHGGIWVKSEPGVFTEFLVSLPLEERHYGIHEINRIVDQESLLLQPVNEVEAVLPVAATSATPGSSSKGRPKILIVDDNLDLREMMQEFLQGAYRVCQAEDGKQGLEMALAEKPDLIISDILMPVEDGISLLGKIKQDPEINHIPVFMLTAKTDDETKEECIKQGAQDVLEKPFSMDFLKWKIKNTLKFQDSLKKAYSKKITAEPTNTPLESPDEQMMKELIRIVEDNLHSHKLGVEFLASELGMSRANLYRKLQKIVNETPVHFIKQIRLKRAKQILETNKFYISEVAFMCGFNSVKYFRRCFQKEYGLTPTEFSKKSQKLPKSEEVN